VNLNASSLPSRIFYSQCAITPIKDNFKLFAFQTSSTISLIKCENIIKWNVFSQIDLKDPSVQKLTISHFEFLPSASENFDSYTKEMLIGYRNGMIVHINYLENSILNKFNVLEMEEREKIISVQSIIINPKTPNNFYVLFSNSLLMQYSIEKTEENQPFLEEKSRIVDKKKAAKNKNKSFIKENNFEINHNKYEGMHEFNFHYGRNLDKLAKNPMNFMFFKCNAISEAKILQNNYFRKLGIEMILAFVGYDGFLRIYDLEQKKPLISFKSNYGGFNNLFFNKTGDLVALSGQDDNIVILSLSNYAYLTIEGHKSFITKVVLNDIDEKHVRVIAGSMDGTFSITDINTIEIGLKNLTNSQFNDKRKYPIRIFFSDFQSKRINAMNINNGNNEGIGSIMFHDPHLIVAGYDGVVSVWSIEIEKERTKEIENGEETENGQKNNNKKENDEEKKSEERNHRKENSEKKKNQKNSKEQTPSKQMEMNSAKKKLYTQKY